MQQAKIGHGLAPFLLEELTDALRSLPNPSFD
jgi:hypothetical protein